MKFYAIEFPDTEEPAGMEGATDFSFPDDVRRNEGLDCPACGRPITSRMPTPPLKAEVGTWGRHYADIGHTSCTGLVVSEKFKDVYHELNSRGLKSFEPVAIAKLRHHARKPREPIPKYWWAEFDRSTRTRVDQTASGYVWVKPEGLRLCPECCWDTRNGITLLKYDRVVVDESSWDGVDIFIPRGGCPTLVTERFKDACIEHEVRNVVFKDALLVSEDDSDWLLDVIAPD